MASETAETSEEERVLLWRQERLMSAGVKEITALLLAASDNDLYVMLSAVERGCDPKTLKRIFRPL